ncbi:hypothetical protein LOTGIDRAFT_131085 [Lottia gigantea]|uniref:Uncharacterized protein n=1 Tax=Lottia gigantea TaxID=225164 RepID=V3ZR70_LOTGI|nr:hypothetical protein LOTGIDRAFT_131085 [Lottia gigantea]ESO85055.1 hypothetical protein LOTGIDRAFT_131085 [Lottia gigantea]
MIKENNKRIIESENIINNTEIKPVLSNVDIALTIISVPRNRHKIEDTYRPKYLSQVVGKLLSLLKTQNTLKSYAIFLCNVHNDPDTFDEIKPLVKRFTTFQRYTTKTYVSDGKFEKEKQDYVYCMNETLHRNVSYVFLIEDDAYPHADLFSVLEDVITKRIENKFSNPWIPKRNVTFIKFYHVPYVLGFCSYEIERVPELLSVSLFFGTLLCKVYLYFVKKKHLKVSYLWILCILYASLVAMCISRQHLLELRRLSKEFYLVTPTPSCCTPAMLYTQYGANLVINKMSKARCKNGYGKDSLLDDIRRKNRLTALMVQPNLFQHIGIYSSLRYSVNLDSIL